ncbi:MAG: sugar-binding transcriptional regulator [Acidobacteriota bacterium]
MDKLVQSIERLAPEALIMVRTRYQIMKEILNHQPIGRRQVATRVGCSERTARSEIDTLRDKGAVDITGSGIVLTDYGRELVQEMDNVMPYLEGLGTLARALKKRFGLEHVAVVPGDSCDDVYTKKDLGRAAARYVRELLASGGIMAVGGGTTLAEMASAVSSETPVENLIVLPARGGVGEEVEEQANTIAARIAKTLGGQYRLLHVPDSLEEETIERLKGNPQVAEIVGLLKKVDVLFYGIGPAMEMANRRGMPAQAMQNLDDKHAVGEAFRYFFNQAGEIVYSVPGIGLELADLKSIPQIVAVAGGSNKAHAIEALLTNLRRGSLVTDEGAARAILGK